MQAFYRMDHADKPPPLLDFGPTMHLCTGFHCFFDARERASKHSLVKFFSFKGT